MTALSIPVNEIQTSNSIITADGYSYGQSSINFSGYNKTYSNLTISSTNFQAKSLTVNGNSGSPVLTITCDGDVVWQGKPSKAADNLTKFIENIIDTKVATRGLRQRTYTRALRSVLHRIKTLEDRDQIIQTLEQMIENREGRDFENLLGEE